MPVERVLSVMRSQPLCLLPVTFSLFPAPAHEEGDPAEDDDAGCH
jgi:hypothetical protein